VGASPRRLISIIETRSGLNDALAKLSIRTSHVFRQSPALVSCSGFHLLVVWSRMTVWLLGLALIAMETVVLPTLTHEEGQTPHARLRFSVRAQYQSLISSDGGHIISERSCDADQVAKRRRSAADGILGLYAKRGYRGVEQLRYGRQPDVAVPGRRRE
jgi:hypothetical protein